MKTNKNETSKRSLCILASTEKMLKLNWKHVGIVFNPIPGQTLHNTVFDKKNETVIARGSEKNCRKFMETWPGAVKRIVKYLAKAEQAQNAKNTAKREECIRLARIAAHEISMRIEERINEIRQAAPSTLIPKGISEAIEKADQGIFAIAGFGVSFLQ